MTADTDRAPPDTLGAETIQFYRANGYVRVPNVLSPDDVAMFRAAADELLDSNAEIWGGEDGAVEVNYVTQAWRKHEALRGLALHPAITGVALRLAGVPLRLYTSEVLAKEPRKSASTLVHDDETGLPLDNLNAALTAWVALVDVPVERGCLSYVPGSHLRAEAHCQQHMVSFEEFAEIEDVWPEFTWQVRTAVPLRAGDVAFHHCRTVHMAGRNDTDVRRMGHGIVFVDDGATYRPGVQDSHLRDLRPGQPLEGDRFPSLPPVG